MNVSQCRIIFSLAVVLSHTATAMTLKSNTKTNPELPEAKKQKISDKAMTLNGYDPDFIGVKIPLPGFSENLNLANDLLQKPSSEAFDSTGAWREYIHYSVATNKARRQPICVALNIDQKLTKQTTRCDTWKVDREIGGEYQLNNNYYRNNDWDKGHMARRSTSSWGLTDEDAQVASDETMYYSNSCLQHKDLNRGEWKAIEDWIADLKDDSNDMVSTFSGPIFGHVDVPTRFIGSPPAEIPAAFFKVLCYLDQNKELATRAFIYLQDGESLKGKQGYTEEDHTMYKVSTEQVEKETGLIFPEQLRTSNPIEGLTLLAPGSNDSLFSATGGKSTPGIGVPADRVTSGVFIAAANLNPSGRKESGREWVSIANYGPDDIDLEGWTLDDGAEKRDPLRLSGGLASGETTLLSDLKDESGGCIVLMNSKGKLVLKNAGGEAVSTVEWTETHDGEVSIFNPV